MRTILHSSTAPLRFFSIHYPLFTIHFALLGALSLISACAGGTDMRPLEKVGVGSITVGELRKLNTSDAEVAELVKLKNEGLSDSYCIELVRVSRSHGREFAAGADVAALHRIGLAEKTVLELARLNVLGAWTDEVRALRLAGTPEELILTLAARRAAGQQVVSSHSVARLKNAGVANDTLLELARRGLTDDIAEKILRLPPRQRSHAALLRFLPAQ
jgi:hypothetical protein